MSHLFSVQWYNIHNISATGDWAPGSLKSVAKIALYQVSADGKKVGHACAFLVLNDSVLHCEMTQCIQAFTETSFDP